MQFKNSTTPLIFASLLIANSAFSESVDNLKSFFRPTEIL